MTDLSAQPIGEGFAEQFRRDLHQVPVVRRVQSLIQSVLAPLPVEVVDIYHGNGIGDPSKLPRLHYLHKISEGAGYLDPLAPQRVAMFRNLGAPTIGGYAWPRSDSAIKAQFDNYVSGMKRAGLCKASGELVDGCYAITDWERTYKSATATIPDLSWAQILEWTHRMQDFFGPREGTYSANWVDHFDQWRDTFPDEPLWYACYNRTLGLQLAAKYNASLLQHTSTATVAGFTGRVDGSMEIKAGTLERLAHSAVTTRPNEVPPVVVVAPPVVAPPVVIAPPQPIEHHQEDLDMANIGIIHLDDADAVFVGAYVGPINGPRFLDVHWVRDAASQAVADAHITAGATVFGGDHPTPGAARLVKANLRNCFVDVLPVGDNKTVWSSPGDIVARTA